MRRRLSSILVAGVLTIATAVFGAVPASAADPWTVTPGGPFRINGGGFSLTDNSTGTQVGCTTWSLSGQFKSGSGLPGYDIGRLFASSTFSGCAAPLGMTFAVTMGGTWRIDALGYQSPGGMTSGTITNGGMRFSGPLCSFTLSGGIIPITYSNNNAEMRFDVGSSSAISGVSGCFGLISNGDRTTLRFGSGFVVPPQIITHP